MTRIQRMRTKPVWNLSDEMFGIVPGLSVKEGREGESELPGREKREAVLQLTAEEIPESVSENSGLTFEWLSRDPGEEDEDSGTAELREILGSHAEGAQNSILWVAVIVLGALVIVLGVFCVSLLLKRRKTTKERMPVQEREKETEMAGQSQESRVSGDVREKGNSVCSGIGKVHNIGRRSGQQDSLGVTAYRGGILAVVADGMGGLADGDKVSQKIVLTMMQDGTSLAGGSTEGRLYQMVAHVNSEVNHMLGMSDQYKSGSTLVAVLVEEGNFQWISVGDSRLYLYRGQRLLQINREHVYEADLLQKAVNQEISFREIAQNPQKKSVSSFIGMGELKQIDGSMRPVTTRQGDRLLLMSDGVFNTLSEEEICDVLSAGENAEQTARALENRVLACQNPKQDNFTAIIIDISY